MGQLTPSNTINLGEINPPASLVANCGWHSPLFSYPTVKDIVATGQISTAGNLALWRYSDNAGTIPISGTPTTAVMNAGSLATISINDGTICSSFQFRITNDDSATAGTITKVGITLGF